MDRHRLPVSIGVTLIGYISLLLLTSLACNQAGEILTPAEATARAHQAVAPTATKAEASEGPQVGDAVRLTGKSYLVSLVDKPGSKRMIAGQERGVEVTILDIAEYEGETWYKIDAPTGDGWVKAENIVTEKP